MADTIDKIPVTEDDCPKCDKFGDDCGEHAPSWEELADYWKTENEQLRHDLERQMSIANEQVNEAERLREHLISALDTLKDAEVCDDNCGPCNEARAALEQSK